MALFDNFEIVPPRYVDPYTFADNNDYKNQPEAQRKEILSIATKDAIEESERLAGPVPDAHPNSNEMRAYNNRKARIDAARDKAIAEAFPKIEGYTAGAKAGDFLASVGQGAVGVVKSAASLPILSGYDGEFTQTLAGYQKWLQSKISDEGNRVTQSIENKSKAVENSGFIEGVKTGLSNIVENPYTYGGQAIGGLATVIPAAALAAGSAPVSLTAGVGLATGAAVGLGGTKSARGDAVKKQALASRLSESAANALALKASETTQETILSDTASAFLGAGETAVGLGGAVLKGIKATAGNQIKQAIYKGAGKAASGESLQEIAQTVNDETGANLALTRAGYDTPTFQGVATKATEGGALGFALGGAAGGVSQYKQNNTPTAPDFTRLDTEAFNASMKDAPLAKAPRQQIANKVYEAIASGKILDPNSQAGKIQANYLAAVKAKGTQNDGTGTGSGTLDGTTESLQATEYDGADGSPTVLSDLLRQADGIERGDTASPTTSIFETAAARVDGRTVNAADGGIANTAQGGITATGSAGETLATGEQRQRDTLATTNTDATATGGSTQSQGDVSLEEVAKYIPNETQAAANVRIKQAVDAGYTIDEVAQAQAESYKATQNPDADTVKFAAQTKAAYIGNDFIRPTAAQIQAVTENGKPAFTESESQMLAGNRMGLSEPIWDKAVTELRKKYESITGKPALTGANNGETKEALAVPFTGSTGIRATDSVGALDGQAGQVTPTDLVGKFVQYGNARGYLQSREDGLYIVDIKGDDDVLVESGLSGQSAQSIGLREVAVPKSTTVKTQSRQAQVVQQATAQPYTSPSRQAAIDAGNLQDSNTADILFKNKAEQQAQAEFDDALDLLSLEYGDDAAGFILDQITRKLSNNIGRSAIIKEIEDAINENYSPFQNARGNSQGNQTATQRATTENRAAQPPTVSKQVNANPPITDNAAEPTSVSPTISSGVSIPDTNVQPNAGSGAAVAAEPAIVRPAKEANLAAIAATSPEIRAEQKRQQDIKRSRVAKLKGYTYAKSPFLAFLGGHGIAFNLKSEFSPDKNPMLSGYGMLFRRNGLSLDALTEQAVQDGFLPQGTDDDAAIYELINRQIRGDSIYPLYTEDGATDQMQAEIDRRAEFEEDAAYDELSETAYTTAELDALEDIPWDTPVGSSSKETTLQAMEAMGFSEQEIKDEIAREQRITQEASQSSNSASQAKSSQPREGATTPTREAEALTAPTRAEVLAQQERAANAPALDAQQQATTNPSDKKSIVAAIEGIFSGMKDAWARLSKHTVVVSEAEAQKILADAADKNITVEFSNVTRRGEDIRNLADNELVARDRFDFAKLEKVGSGSDRDVYSLGNGDVVKVAKTARGLLQNQYEGDYLLKGLLPEVSERGLNYVVVPQIENIKASDLVDTFNEDGDVVGKAKASEMLTELAKFSQRDFDNKTDKLQTALEKYGFSDIQNYDVLWNDFIAKRNWGYKDGTAWHTDGGTIGGESMLDQYRGVKNLDDADFRTVYNVSKAIKKELGDADKATMYSKSDADTAQAFFLPPKVKGEQGKIYLIADRITKGQEASVWFHEVFHKRGEELLGKENLKKLYDNVQGWKSRPDGSVERQIYEAANKRATDSGEYDAEFLTYAIEEANNRGVTPDASKGTITAAGWLAKVKTLFTNALRKLLSGYAGNIDISANDLMAMAYGAAKLEYEGKTAGERGSGVVATSQAPFDGIEKAVTPLGDTKTVTVNGKEYSVFNSDGKPIHGTVEGVRNFVRWFSDSRVTDNGKAMSEGGKPLTVYHGTGNKFNVFKPTGSTRGNDVTQEIRSVKVNAFFFSDSKESAQYVANVRANTVSDVKPIYIKAEYIKRIEDGSDVEDIKGVNQNVLNVWENFDNSLFVESFKEEYDGASFEEKINGEWVTTYVVFEPTQIKSATGNTGDFNPANPDIRFSRVSDVVNTAKDLLTGNKLSDSGKKLQDALDAATPNQKVNLLPPKSEIDIQWAMREALVDYQAPVARMLEKVYGFFNDAPLWQSLKTYATKRDALHENFGQGFRKKMEENANEIANATGMDVREAASAVGEYAKALHIPDANKALRERRFNEIALQEVERVRRGLQNKADRSDAELVLGVNFGKLAGRFKGKVTKKAMRELYQSANVTANLVKLTEADIELAMDKAEARFAKDGFNKLAGGMTDEQAQATIKAIESQIPKALLQAGAKHLVDANREGMELAVKANLMTKAQQQNLLQKYPNYVPLTMADTDADPFSEFVRTDMFSASMNANIAKVMKGYTEGSGSVAENGYVNTLAKRAAIHARIASQDFKVAALEMSRTDKGKEHVVSELITAPNQQLDPQGMAVRDPKTGEWYSVKFKDESVQAAVYNQGIENPDAWLKVLAIPTRAIAKGVTQAILVFAPINMLRDVQAKIFQIRANKYIDKNGQPVDSKKLGASVLKYAMSPEMWRAAAQIAFKKTPEYPSPMYLRLKAAADGGALSTWGDFLNKSKEDAYAELRKTAGMGAKFNKLKNIVEEWNTWFDTISSFAAYNALIDQDVAPKAAAFHTLDMMNFRNKGKKTALIRSMYVFSNATLQDAANISTQLKSKRGRSDLIALTVLFAVFEGIAQAIGGEPDDEEEKKYLGNNVNQRGTFEAERNFSLCWAKDGCLKLPVGFGIPMIARMLSVNSIRAASGRYSPSEALGETAKGITKTFTPTGYSEVPITQDPTLFIMNTLAPTIVKPLVNVAANKTAFGSDLANKRVEGKYASENPKGNTEAIWVDAAKSMRNMIGFDTAPEKVREVFLSLPLVAGPIAEAIKAATNNKAERGVKTDIRDDMRFLAPLGINRVLGGDSRYLESVYYERLRDGEELAKRMNVEVPQTERPRRGQADAMWAKRVNQMQGISDVEKALLIAYREEKGSKKELVASKKEMLEKLKNSPVDTVQIAEKFNDETRKSMLDFLKRSKFKE